MSALALTLALALAASPAQAAPSTLPPELSPSVVRLSPLPVLAHPVPRPVNCTPAVIAGAAVMLVSAAVFVRGMVDDDDPLKTGGAIGETIGAAVLIFGVSRPSCL